MELFKNIYMFWLNFSKMGIFMVWMNKNGFKRIFISVKTTLNKNFIFFQLEKGIIFFLINHLIKPTLIQHFWEIDHNFTVLSLEALTSSFSTGENSTSSFFIIFENIKFIENFIFSFSQKRTLILEMNLN